MKKIIKGFGLVLIWELVRYICNMLLFMFLGKVWIILIATTIFSIIIVRFIYSRRYSNGETRRKFIDTILIDENHTNTIKEYIRDVLRYTDVKNDIISSLFIIPLPALYISTWPDLIVIDDVYIPLFIIIVSIIGFILFTIIDVTIWILIHKRWGSEYKITTCKSSE